MRVEQSEAQTDVDQFKVKQDKVAARLSLLGKDEKQQIADETNLMKLWKETSAGGSASVPSPSNDSNGKSTAIETRNSTSITNRNSVANQDVEMKNIQLIVTGVNEQEATNKLDAAL